MRWEVSDLDCVFRVGCFVNATFAHRVGAHADGLLHYVAIGELETLAMQLLRDNETRGKI